MSERVTASDTDAVVPMQRRLRPPAGSDMLPHVYRITKYDPADRGQHGHYIGAESAISDQGPVEAAYLMAVAAFAEDTGFDQLAIHGPEIGGYARFGPEPAADGQAWPASS
ncbi:hypothetical protein [Streptomyces sp. NPDC006510]|uniref:hypothetical protein n=1 Tax=Streptomyces sp. NPDC006510 TaxID=3155600 RepID=UPI0033BC2F0B